MSAIRNAAYVEPISLGGLTFGPDCIVSFDGCRFILVWPHFEVSEVDDSITVGRDVLDPNVVYPLGGNIVSKNYMHSLPDELWANWRAFSICGHPQFPAYYILDPSPMSYGACFTVLMPSSLHLGSFLRQSNAEHPPNVSFLCIIEATKSDSPRYRANLADLFFKAQRELPPGTILYADLEALFEFFLWTPEAQRNADDHDWDEPIPAVAPGVYFLEASGISNASPGPACPLPLVSASVVEVRDSDNRNVDASSSVSISRAQDTGAAGRSASLVDSSSRATVIPCSEFLVEDSNSITGSVTVQSSRLAAARAFLTPREERTKAEVAAIVAARAGQVPPLSSREGGYMSIPLPGGTHHDWMAMTSYLVTELEESGRAVSDEDLRRLKKWLHNYRAVLRRSARAGSDVSTSTKRARSAVSVPVAAVDRVHVVPARLRREPRYYDPHGPPTEGDFASAGRRVAVQGGDEGGFQSGVATSSRVDVSGPSAVVAPSHNSANVSVEAALAPTIQARNAALHGRDNSFARWNASRLDGHQVRSAALHGRDNEEGRSAFTEEETAPAATVRARSAALPGRDSEEGRCAIRQAEVILAAARRELASVLDVLGSARAIVDGVVGSVADCSAAVATARRHLGRGSSGDDQDA